MADRPPTGVDPIDAGAGLVAELDAWADLTSTTVRSVVAAGLRAFAARGFHGTTIKHIAEGSGLSTAALYVHFRSKEQLLYEIILRGHRTAAEITTAATTFFEHPPSAARTFAYAFGRWHAEQREIARVAQYELAALSPEHWDEVRELRRRTETAVRELVVRGHEDGSFAVDDPRGTASALLSLGIDVARWYQPDGSYSPDDVGRQHADLALRLLGAAKISLPVSKPRTP